MINIYHFRLFCTMDWEISIYRLGIIFDLLGNNKGRSNLKVGILVKVEVEGVGED